MMVYICTKFHENILNGIRVIEQTRKVNGRTDGCPDVQTDGQTDRRTKYMHEVLVNRLGGLSLPRKSVVRLTYPPDMTLDPMDYICTTFQENILDDIKVIELT